MIQPMPEPSDEGTALRKLNEETLKRFHRALKNAEVYLFDALDYVKGGEGRVESEIDESIQSLASAIDRTERWMAQSLPSEDEKKATIDEAVSAVNSGCLVNVSRENYVDYLRSAMLDKAAEWIDTDQATLYLIMLNEVRRLDALHGLTTKP